jgi:hypothetical protein
MDVDERTRTVTVWHVTTLPAAEVNGPPPMLYSPPTMLMGEDAAGLLT